MTKSLGDTLDKYLGITFKFLGKVFKIVKWLFLLIGIGLLCYGCYKAFGYLFFVGFFLVAPISLWFLNKFLEVPSSHILECRLGSKVKEKPDRLGLVKVPNKKLKDIPREGGHMIARDTVSGKPLYIVEEYSDKKIEVAWFDQISSIKFWGDKEAFVDLQKIYLTDYRDMIVLKKNWQIYNVMEINRKYEFMDYKTKIEDIAEKVKKDIEEVDK